jgi:hypothetical protein
MTVIKCGVNTARKIVINVGDKDETQYALLPGGADAPEVEVPPSVLDIEFVKGLINSGDIVVVKSEATTDNIENLRNQCKLLGIKFERNWSESKLQEAINKFTE